MGAWHDEADGQSSDRDRDGGSAALLAADRPRWADVKAGVEAWSRGDYAAAVHEWQGPAAAGDPDAMFNLAQAYRLGRGVPQDSAQGRGALRAALRPRVTCRRPTLTA